MKKTYKKIVSLAVAASMIVSTNVAAYATEDIQGTKAETVYTMMNADGNVDKVIVTEHIQKNADVSELKVQSNIDGLELIMKDVEVKQEGENITFLTEESDLYYKGTSTQSLPVTTEITYTLDGKEVSAKDVIGATGHLVMSIKQVNNETRSITVGEKQETIYLPFESALVMDIENEVIENVEISHGKLVDDGSIKVITAMLTPGFKENFPDLESEHLTDEIVIEGNVTNFEIANFYMTTVCKLPKLELGEIFNDLSGMDDKMADFQDAGSKLEDGSKTLNSGVKTYFGKQTEAFDSFDMYIANDKKLLQSLVAFNNGFVDFSTGLKLYLSGAAEIFAGIDSIATMTPKLVEGMSGFRAGLSQALPEMEQTKPIYAGLTQVETGLQQVNAGMQKLNQGAKVLSEKTPVIEGGLAKLEGASGQLSKGSQALLEKTGLLTAGLDQLEKAGVKIVDGSNDLNKGVTKLKTEGIDTLVEEVEASLERVEDYQEKYDAIYEEVQNYNSFTGENKHLDSEITFITKVTVK